MVDNNCSRLSEIMVINRTCCFCKTSIAVEHNGKGDDFVMINQRGCQCLSCPRCILEHSVNRKSKPILCPVDGEVVQEIKYFLSSRVKAGRCHSINVDQFSTDIDKEPGRIFLNELKKNKEHMMDKMFLNLTFVTKPLDSENGVPQVTTMTSILDSKHGFESEKEKDKLRHIFGLLHLPIMSFHSTEIETQKIPWRTPAKYCDYCLESDESLLLKLLYALTSVHNLMDKVNLRPLDAFVLSYDNFGFKGRKGKEKTDFEDLLQEFDGDHFELAKSIVEPKRSDYNALKHRVMTAMKTAASLDMPSPVDCRDILDSDGAVKCQHRYPTNLGVRINTMSADWKAQGAKYSDFVSTDFFRTKEKSNDSDDEPPSTFYEMNDITLDHALHGDPGSLAVTERIVQYLDEASFVDPALIDLDDSGGEFPVRNIIAPATADGSPAKRWLDFQAADIKSADGVFEDRTYKSLRVFFTGFHFMMEFLTMRGKVTRDFTSYFARRQRPKEPALNWIYMIRDPDDALHEWREYLLKHYKATSESCGSTNEVDMHIYQIKRCIKVPTCQAVLFDLRLLEIVFMIGDAEKVGEHGDVPLFLATLQFSLPPFAITAHAKSYCHLVCDFLEWHKLASDAERILFENFFYTKLSNNEKPIWADRGVEWTVRHVRQFMGHRVCPHNHNKVVEQTISDIPFLNKAKRDLRFLLGYEDQKDYTTGDWNNQTVEIGKAGLHTRVALDETNFWGPGPLQGDLECCDSNSFVQADGDDKEHKASCSLFDGYNLGIERIKSYYVEHHIRNHYVKKRSEENVCLKFLPTTHDRQERDLGKNKILDKLDYYRDYCFLELPNSTALKQQQLVEVLCQCCKQFFKEFPEICESTKSAVEELDQSDAATTSEDQANQIWSLIYILDEDFLPLMFGEDFNG
eukprot:jgi/Psemu1/9029/gm1.9029_g